MLAKIICKVIRANFIVVRCVGWMAGPHEAMSSSAASNNASSLSTATATATATLTKNATMTTMTDCPICLCPITSEPWGVVNPCGHPYHRECWTEVVANHAAAGGGRRNTKNAQCAICKGTTRGFVPVFVDLGDDNEGDYYGGGGGASASRNDGRGDSDGDGLIHIDGDYEDEDVLEKLADESDGLWTGLDTLFGNENADEEIVDITERSDGDVASICVAIDLTQRPSPPMRRNVDQAREFSAPSDATQIKKSVEERTRIQHILKRLKCIHDEILGSLQRPRQRHSHSPLATARQLERLKSKVLRLQSINADLNSHAKSLQTLNEKLCSTLDEFKRTASDATVEAERVILRYETLNKKYELMDESYRRHVDRSKLDKNLLQNEITKLQAKYARLSDRSDLQDMREMEEIRAKYRKMSQEVHDLKSKNARLSEESERKEREWEVRYRKETERCDGLVQQVKRLSERVGKDGGKSSGEGRICGPAGRRGGEEAGANFDGGLCVGSDGRVNNGGLTATVATARRDGTSKPSGRVNARDLNPFGLVGKSVAPIRQISSSFASDVNGHTAQRNSTTKDNGSIVVAVGRAQTAAASLGGGKAHRGGKAMEALDKATARKFPMHLKRPLQPQNNHHSSQCRQSHYEVPYNDEARRGDSDDDAKECSNHTREKAKRACTDEIQLMMKIGPPHASNKRWHGSNCDSINHTDDHDAAQSGLKSVSTKNTRPSIAEIRSDALDLALAATSSSSRLATAASFSPRRKGNIASYFKRH